MGKYPTCWHRKDASEKEVFSMKTQIITFILKHRKNILLVISTAAIVGLVTLKDVSVHYVNKEITLDVQLK